MCAQSCAKPGPDVESAARNAPGPVTTGGIMGDDRVVIAIDIGGTALKCALVGLDSLVGLESPEIRHTERHPTGADRGPDAVAAAIVEVAAGLAGKARADGL